MHALQYQVQEANPALSVYRLHMNDRTYPKFHGHLLKPYLSSPRFHQTSPVTHQSDTGRRSILQILDDRVYRGHRQLRVVLSGDGPNGQWRNLDDLRTHDGFRALYDEYIGDDELALWVPFLFAPVFLCIRVWGLLAFLRGFFGHYWFFSLACAQQD